MSELEAPSLFFIIVPNDDLYAFYKPLDGTVTNIFELCFSQPITLSTAPNNIVDVPTDITLAYQPNTYGSITPVCFPRDKQYPPKIVILSPDTTINPIVTVTNLTTLPIECKIGDVSAVVSLNNNAILSVTKA